MIPKTELMTKSDKKSDLIFEPDSWMSVTFLSKVIKFFIGINILWMLQIWSVVYQKKIHRVWDWYFGDFKVSFSWSENTFFVAFIYKKTILTGVGRNEHWNLLHHLISPRKICLNLSKTTRLNKTTWLILYINTALNI